MWMPGADDRAARRDGAQRGRDERAHGGEDQRGVERLRPGAIASPAHSAPSERASACARVVLGAGEREHAPPLVHRHLADDVRGGPEPVEPEPLRVAREPQRAVADQPAAQQRRELPADRPSAGSGKQKRSSATAHSA